MNTLVRKKERVFATKIWFADSKLCVLLADCREIGVPIDWFPRLRDAPDKDRNNWRLIGNGQGIHWSTINEDISVSSLIELTEFKILIRIKYYIQKTQSQ
jgi:hypothetical protein